MQRPLSLKTHKIGNSPKQGTGWLLGNWTMWQKSPVPPLLNAPLPRDLQVPREQPCPARLGHAVSLCSVHSQQPLLLLFLPFPGVLVGDVQCVSLWATAEGWHEVTQSSLQPCWSWNTLRRPMVVTKMAAAVFEDARDAKHCASHSTGLFLFILASWRKVLFHL